MNKNFILVPILFFCGSLLFAQKNSVDLISSTDNETTISFKLDSYTFNDVLTNNGNEKIIVANDLTQIMQKGAPDLPKFSTSIIIPDKDLMAYEIISSDFIEMKDIYIAPSKGNLTRDIDPGQVLFEYDQKIYSKDAFFPYGDAQLNSPFIVRDYRGQTLWVYPFKYNPVTHTLRIYTEITIRVYSTGKEGENRFERMTSLTKINKEFKQLYSKRFINFGTYSKYTPVEEEGNMLIICYDNFMDEMADFVTWKNTIGRPTEIVAVSTIGTTSSAIKTFVTNYYNTNGLAYLLLVGDAAQIPTNSGGTLGGDSDNAYAYILGNDHYLDFFVGRFSAETDAQVITQVQRTLTYENGSTLAAGWLNVPTGVASDQGPGDDNEYDYQHIRNIQTQLVNNFTYTAPYYELYDGSQGGYDASGNPSPSQVSTAINTGTGIITYTGHGSDQTWGTSGFSNTNVDALTNDNKLPFIWSVACVNGNFVGLTCFAEAWLRSTNGSNPAGAIAMLAATINQSWDPPMAAQDEMVDILAESYLNNIKRTFAGLSINGCHLMNDEYSDFAMTDTWTCFGDPSLYVRTDNPANMAISHNDVVIIGETDFAVSCNFNGALATLSRAGTIIGSAVVSGGTANIPVVGITPGETLTLAVVGFNKITYLANLNVIAPAGPYIVVNSYVNQVDFGQSTNLDITLKNVGQDPAYGVNVTASESDPNASISNPTYSFGTIAAGAITSTSSGVFTLNVDNDLQDQYVVPVTFAITDGNKTLWQQTKNVTVNAPVFSIGNLLVDDASGNGDGILDPGETANLNIQVTNTGHADVSNVIGQISSMSPYLIINSSMTSPDILSVGETGIFTFNVTASIAAQDGTVADIAFDLTAGASNQYTAAQAFEIVIGFVPEYCAASGGCDEYITRVEIGTIDNSSACDGYFNYTDISTDVDLGVSYPITVTVGTPYTSDAVSAFVDWNYDGDFSDADETYDLLWNYSTAKATGNILVPEGITPRNVTIRIRLTYSEIPTSCGTTTYGEVEDYTLSIQPGITQGGTLMATYNFICIGSSTGDMTLSNNSGTITDWEKRLNNGTWASIGFTGSTYSETPSDPGIWEYRVEVDNGGAYSNNVAIQVRPEIIASFTYTAENQTISFLNTSIEATSFAWDFGDGKNSTETNPVHIYTASGNYNVTLTGSNNVCPDNIYGESIPVNFVGLDDLDAKLTIIPNPSNGKFILTANGLNNSILSIYSVNGQKIYETRISDDYLEVDLNTVSAGVYFIELINNQIRINKKLIIK